MRRIFGFFIGIFVGWLVGGTLALLLAPASGEALRNELRGRSAGFIGEIQGAAQARRLEMEQRLAELRAPRTRSKAG